MWDSNSRQTPLLTVLEVENVQLKVPAVPGLGEDSPPGLQMATFSLCPLELKTELWPPLLLLRFFLFKVNHF